MAKVGSGGGVRHLKGGHHVCQDVHYHAMSIEVVVVVVVERFQCRTCIKEYRLQFARLCVCVQQRIFG